MTQCTIHERGNGLPDIGDYVAGDDGELYLVTATHGPIHTGPPGAGNYIHATVELADWSDCSEDDQHTASVILDEVES